MSELSEVAVNAQADALAALLAGGAFRLYEGNRLLVELPFQTPAAGVAVDGTVTWRMGSAEAIARGNPSVYKAFSADGRLVEIGTVGRYGADLIVSYDTIEKGGRVSVSNFVHKVPR